MGIRLIVIAFGGACGAVARYGVSGWVHSSTGAVFPWGTFAVNVIGSGVMGFLWGIFESAGLPPSVRQFLMVGFLGSFTTFSTFSLESFQLLRDGEHGWAMFNIGASVIVGLGALIGGLWLSRYLLQAGH